MRALRAHPLAGAHWAGALLAAIALTALVATYDRLPGDLPATRAVQTWPFPGEPLADALRLLTGTEVVAGAGAALAALAWMAGWHRPALALALGLALTVLLQIALKEIIDHPRPTPDLVDLRAGFRSASFPAGHAMSATCGYGFLAAAALATPLPAAAKAALVGFVVVVLGVAGLANVFLGVHWPSDVVGGYLWALAVLIPAARAAFPSRP